MAGWTRRCLLTVSLLVAVTVARAGTWLLPLEGRQQFAVTIAARGVELTGVCVVKTGADGSRGTLVNEFGVHALDFLLTADRRRVRLLNVVAQLDRWYIRRVVRRDLQHLFGATAAGHPSRHREVTVGDDGCVVLVNTKYNIRYTIHEIRE